jgi:asparagine synthase (glutamine-hydrolysing)
MMLEQEPWKQMAATLARQQAGPDGHWLSALQYLDIKHYLPLDILTKVDRMSMANSLETRVPLLDHKLVEFAATIPPGLRLRDGNTKHIFKQAMRGILPDSIIDRGKQGFAVPLDHWFRAGLGSYVRELLLSPASKARRIFNPDYIEKLLQLQHRGRSLDLQLWTLISFELWCRTFLDRPVAAPVVPMPRPVRQGVWQ